VAGAIDPASEPVQVDARDIDLLEPLAIDKRDANDGWDLAQHTQSIDTMLLFGARSPGLLDGPAELVVDALEKAADLPGRRCGFGAQDAVEHRSPVAIAEPGVADAIDEQRNDDGDEQDEKVFLEQGSPQSEPGMIHG